MFVERIPWQLWALLVVFIGYRWIAARIRLGIINRRRSGAGLVIGNNWRTAWSTRWLATTVVLMAIGIFRFGLGALVAWFLAINTATLLVFGWDKLKSIVAGRRVPDTTMLTFAAAGGSTGLLVGIDLFKHHNGPDGYKFRRRLGNLIVLQAAVVLWLLHSRGGG